jgi:hypothetical protein
MTGRSPRISGGGGFEDIGLTAGKAEVTRIMPSINACHVATELDPPEHETSSYVLDIAPSGAIRDVRTFGKGTHPKFDSCMMTALRQTKWPATKSGAKSAKIFFTATIADP